MKRFKSKFGGTVLYSPYFGRNIIVTSYFTDSLWKFRFSGDTEVFTSQTKFSYFVKKGLVRGCVLSEVSVSCRSISRLNNFRVTVVDSP